MGIYDRDYYRRDGPGLFGSLAEQGRVTVWLIGINIACFVLQFVTRTQGPRGGWHEPFTEALLLDPDKVMAGEVWRLGTYAFLHSTRDIWHIVFNMLVLFFFGRQVEERVGSREYLAFYLLGAVLSGVAFLLGDLGGLLKGHALGASGAVTAALVLAACYNPRQIILLFFVIPVPIWAVVAFMIVSDLIPFLRRDSGAVATSAHLGGAAFGFAYYRLGLKLTEWGLRWPKRRSRPQLRLYREEDDDRPAVPVAPRAAPARHAEDEQLEAQLDDILAKIPRVGMEGLTESERQVLRKASEAAKRRRS